GGTERRPVHRYRFPAQDHDIRTGDDVCIAEEGACIGKVEKLDFGAGTVDIQHSGKWADERPTHVFARRNVPPGVKPEVLLELGQWIVENGIDASGGFRAARDLIRSRPPRLVPGSK